MRVTQAPDIDTNVTELTDGDRHHQQVIGGDPRSWLKASLWVKIGAHVVSGHTLLRLTADELRDISTQLAFDADELDRQACDLVCTPQRQDDHDLRHWLPCPTAYVLQDLEADERDAQRGAA